MSERIEQSMYDRFPFEEWERLGHTSRLKRKIDRLRLRARMWYLKRHLSRKAIAETKVNLAEVTRFTAEAFPDSGPAPWLDRPDAAQRIERLVEQGRISRQKGDQAEKFIKDGYIILERFFSSEVLDEVWSEYERAVFEGKVNIETYQKDNGDLYLGRCLNPHKSVPRLKRLTHDRRLIELLTFLMGVESIPFQTITGFAGSEQPAHSDAIHMGTYPLGYLTAAWIAFEDIHPDCGPLEYYPGSHRLPYIFTHHLSPEPVALEYRRTLWYNEVYESEIRKMVRERDLRPHYLDCKKGDVLIWHSNLLHGGSKRNDRALSRRAMVGHYFGKGAICFGDRNAILLDPYQA